jgi:acyl-CoA synthetase (AMP-forming)/AMP-acid ligase II
MSDPHTRSSAMTADQMLETAFTPFADILRARAQEAPDSIAIMDARERLDWRRFDERIDRVAARLQAEGVGRGDAVAIAGYNAVGYVVAFVAALRTGAVAAPLTSSATPEAIAAMLGDCGARYLFVDAALGEPLATDALPARVQRIAFDDGPFGEPMSEWMGGAGSMPVRVDIQPADPFNIIYSSGTTGTPKGIVQSHAMRMGHVRRAAPAGYDRTAVTIISTPLYSNTTLVSLIPALAGGGRVLLMPRFEARAFLELAQRERATHAMLVPVQYARIMALPGFGGFDLSSFRYKSATSAPFPAALKADVLRRWPGRLVDVYGMTEGGGTCILQATDFPDKLHTVGRPAEDHDIRLIGEDGREVAPGEAGEVVGRSETMMSGYHNQKAKTRDAEWYDSQGRRYIRHGDIGRFDADGFLVLIDRAKDMIISGGFNIYPSDLEAALDSHPAVAEAAVVGLPSEQWGETPVAFVVLRDSDADAGAILAQTNARLGRTQRITSIHVIDEMPRSAIGKVLKRELRERAAVPNSVR